MSTAQKLIPKVEAKTAAYTVDIDDWGKILTNRGDGDALTITLPAAASVPSGFYVEVFVVADFAVTVATAAGELVTKNDAAANSVAWSTATEIIGAGGKFVSDGTSWLAFLNTEETVTTTVAT